jgi:hypothetical protein
LTLKLRRQPGASSPPPKSEEGQFFWSPSAACAGSALDMHAVFRATDGDDLLNAQMAHDAGGFGGF